MIQIIYSYCTGLYARVAYIILHLHTFVKPNDEYL